MSESLVAINRFEGPGELRERFIAEWEEMARWVRVQKGFIRARLCERHAPGERFGLTAVVEWESEEAQRQAYTQMPFAPLLVSKQVTLTPSLSRVIRDVTC